MARILVVDDNPRLRGLVRTVLKVDGHSVLEAGDPEAAIAALQRERPPVAIIDVELDHGARPGAGLALTRQIKADPASAGTRIVLCTGAAEARQREAGLAAGADRYVVKPFSPRALLAVVSELLDRPHEHSILTSRHRSA